MSEIKEETHQIDAKGDSEVLGIQTRRARAYEPTIKMTERRLAQNALSEWEK